MRLFFPKVNSIKEEIFDQEHFDKMENLKFEDCGESSDIINVDLTKLTTEEMKEIARKVDNKIFHLECERVKIIESNKEKIKQMINDDEIIQKMIFRYSSNINERKLWDSYIVEMRDFYKSKSNEEKFILTMMIEEVFEKISDNVLLDFVQQCCQFNEINEAIGSFDLVFERTNVLSMKKYKKDA